MLSSEEQKSAKEEIHHSNCLLLLTYAEVRNMSHQLLS